MGSEQSGAKIMYLYHELSLSVSACLIKPFQISLKAASGVCQEV